MAENPTSSSTTYTTLAAPSGALGGSNGDQSGTESRMSVLITPLNGLPIIGSSGLLPGGARVTPWRHCRRCSNTLDPASPGADETAQFRRENPYARRTLTR